MKITTKYKMLSKKTIAIVLVTTLLGTASVYGYIKVNKSNKEDSQLVSREREYLVKKGDITAGASGSGTLKLEQVSQSFKESVMIGEVFVKEGQNIKKGDKVASISEKFINDKLKELNNQLDQANATLNSAKNTKQSTVLTQNKAWEDKVKASKTQYETQRNSIVSNINSLTKRLEEINIRIKGELKGNQSSLEAEKSSVESELKSANVSLNTLDNNRNIELKQESKEATSNNEINALSNSSLDVSITNAQKEVDKINEEISKVNKLKENSILYAEADGIVLALKYAAGATTILENPVITIGKADKVLAEIAVSQNDITKIQEGQDVKILVSAFQEEEFTGKVKSSNLKPNTQGNTTNYSVIVEVDKNDSKLLEGMTVSAQFIVKEVKDVLMLSNKAITLKSGKQIVNVKKEDGTRKEVEIATGFSDGKNTEIKSGLSEGDTVVIGGE